MGKLQVVYGAFTTVAGSLAAMPSDSTLVSGYAMAQIDNNSGGALDYLISGQTTTGSAVDARQIQVWLYADTGASAYAGNATGGAAILAVGTAERTNMRFLTSIQTDAGADHVYEWGPYSVSEAFGGFTPGRFGIWQAQNTGDPLNATHANSKVVYRTVDVSAA